MEKYQGRTVLLKTRAIRSPEEPYTVTFEEEIVARNGETIAIDGETVFLLAAENARWILRCKRCRVEFSVELLREMRDHEFAARPLYCPFCTNQAVDAEPPFRSSDFIVPAATIPPPGEIVCELNVENESKTGILGN
jgi:hypothetical protein